MLTDSKMGIEVTETNIKIIDSYKIRASSSMLEILSAIRKEYGMLEGNLVLKRSDKSLIQEWMGHNLCYDLHIKRSSTRDVDLDSDDSFKKRMVYCIASILYRLYV